MVYHTSCNVLTYNGQQELARCLVPIGTITMDEKWVWISTTVVPIARTILVTVTSLAIWHLWWWSRYSSRENQSHHGSSWAIGTTMTHMSGVSTSIKSLQRVAKYGIGKVTPTLLLLLAITGLIIPLASIYWASHVFQVGEVNYEYEKFHQAKSNLMESIKNRTALVSSFGKVAYSEKPLLTSDVFNDASTGMGSAVIISPKGAPSWWKVDILPKTKECYVHSVAVLSSSTNVEFSVDYGDSGNDKVAESLTSRCTRVKPSVSFLTAHSYVNKNSTIASSELQHITNTNLPQQWCQLSYTCAIDTRVSYGSVSINTEQKMVWQKISETNSNADLNSLLSQFQTLAQLDNQKLNVWLETADNWKEKAINIIKEAATIKYGIYSTLGYNQPAHQIFSETINEFLREAILMNFGDMKVQIKGSVSKVQFSWITGLFWVVIVLVAGVILAVSNSKAKQEPLLKEMLESWDIVSKTAITSHSKASSEIALYKWPTVYENEQDINPICYSDSRSSAD